MSNQCQNYGGCYATRRTAFCADWAIAFLGWLFTLALGIILGTVFNTTFTPILATVIVFAIIMLVGIIALLIYRYCVYCR